MLTSQLVLLLGARFRFNARMEAQGVVLAYGMVRLLLSRQLAAIRSHDAPSACLTMLVHAPLS